MAYMTNHPVTIDGVRLDTLAWGIETKTHTTGGLRTADVSLPGLDGTVASLYDSRDPALLTLGMFVRGTDEDGLVPAGTDSIRQLRENLDALLALFGQTHRLVDVREVVDPSAAGTAGTRQAAIKFADSFAPDLEIGQVARLSVVGTIPSGYWRDVATQDWTLASVAPGTDYAVPTLTGGTGPVTDGIFTITGPLNDPALVDVTTGHKVRLPGALTAGQTWRINSATWETRTGTLGLGSADTTGTSRAATTETVGVTPYLMPLRPAVVGGVPQVKVRVEGTGATSATALGIRTRKAYL